MKIIAQGLGSIGALVGLGMFVHDTLARVFPFANPISARNNIMYILATAAFVEAVKHGSMEMTDFIVTYGDEKDQMSNSEMIIDTMFKATFTGVGLNVAGQNPLVKHGYTLYKSWDVALNQVVSKRLRGFRADQDFRQNVESIKDDFLRNSIVEITKKFEKAIGLREFPALASSHYR